MTHSDQFTGIEFDMVIVLDHAYPKRKTRSLCILSQTMAKSKRKLRALASRDKETRILNEMSRSLLDPNTSIRKIAKDARLARSTLIYRLDDGQSNSASKEAYHTCQRQIKIG